MKLVHSLATLLPAAVLSTPTGQSCDMDRIIGGNAIQDGNPPFEAEWIVGLSMGCGATAR